MARDSHVLTFPNMDSISRVYELLFTELGCDFLSPPPLSDQTSEKGRELGREGFCQPLNNTLGDLYLAIEAGATAVVMTAGCDPCRYGTYWVNQKVILEESFGFEIPFFVVSHIEPQASIRGILDALGVTCTDAELDAVWHHTMRKISMLAELNTAANRARAGEAVRGATTDVYRRVVDGLLGCRCLEETESVFARGLESLARIEQRPIADPVRILLVGAIYEVMEPRANYHIEEYLATLGAEVERSLTYHDLVPIISQAGRARRVEHDQMLYRHAKRYLSDFTAGYGYGGYGPLTIGHSGRARADGFDGIIHLHSFSCMPEIIAKAFLRRISQVEAIPALSLVVEEISSRDLFCNRLDAFVDVVRSHKADARRSEATARHVERAG